MCLLDSSDNATIAFMITQPCFFYEPDSDDTLNADQPKLAPGNQPLDRPNETPNERTQQEG